MCFNKDLRDALLCKWKSNSGALIRVRAVAIQVEDLNEASLPLHPLSFGALPLGAFTRERADPLSAKGSPALLRVPQRSRTNRMRMYRAGRPWPCTQ